MAPTVIMIRHAEALHNFSIPDPSLTEQGFTQCRELAEFLRTRVPMAQQIDLIITSPLRRTLQTTQAVLGWLMERNVPVVLGAEWQESTDKPCDTGSSVSALSSAFPQFDFTGLDPIFPKKSGLYEYSDAGLARRVRAAKELLRDRPEATIVVVSHAGFLRRVTDRRFGNADFRVFSFDGDEPKEEDGGSSTELPAISRGPLIPVAVSNQALGALVLDSPPAPILAAGVSLEGVVEDTTGAGTLHIGKARIGIKSVVRPVTNADPTLVLHEWAMTELKGGGMGRSPKGLASLDDHSHAIRKTGFLGVEAPPPRPKSR